MAPSWPPQKNFRAEIGGFKTRAIFLRSRAISRALSFRLRDIPRSPHAAARSGSDHPISRGFRCGDPAFHHLAGNRCRDRKPRRTGKPSVSVLMKRYRREWMRQFIERDPRIFDGNILSSLREGTAFFASACMIATGGHAGADPAMPIRCAA